MPKAILIFLFSFSLATAVQAGTLTISNKDCNPWGKSSVHVNIWDPDTKMAWDADCTHTGVSLRHGESKTISLTHKISGKDTTSNQSFTHTCWYKHEADGTVGGSRDIPGGRDSRVHCENDWIGVCQCYKQ